MPIIFTVMTSSGLLKRKKKSINTPNKSVFPNFRPRRSPILKAKSLKDEKNEKS